MICIQYPIYKPYFLTHTIKLNYNTMKVIIKVIKDNYKGYGYNLTHNQQPGFKGIISNTFAWYRLKSEALKRADELMKCWN